MSPRSARGVSRRRRRPPARAAAARARRRAGTATGPRTRRCGPRSHTSGLISGSCTRSRSSLADRLHQAQRPLAGLGQGVRVPLLVQRLGPSTGHCLRCYEGARAATGAAKVPRGPLRQPNGSRGPRAGGSVARRGSFEGGGGAATSPARLTPGEFGGLHRSAGAARCRCSCPGSAPATTPTRCIDQARHRPRRHGQRVADLRHPRLAPAGGLPRAVHPGLDHRPRAQAHLEAGRDHDDRGHHRLRAGHLQRHHPRAPRPGHRDLAEDRLLRGAACLRSGWPSAAICASRSTPRAASPRASSRGSTLPDASGARPDRNLALELVRTTEYAALAAARWIGRGRRSRPTAPPWTPCG